jgi:hypothetical protein
MAEGVPAKLKGIETGLELDPSWITNQGTTTT